MSKRTSVRIPDELYDELAKRAKRERRSLSNLIIALLAEAVSQSVSSSGQDQSTTDHYRRDTT
jgi:predicted CopG family antitoxin